MNYISNYVFSNCPRIENTEIPKSGEKIREFAFFGTKSLKSFKNGIQGDVKSSFESSGINSIDIEKGIGANEKEFCYDEIYFNNNIRKELQTIEPTFIDSITSLYCFICHPFISSLLSLFILAL